MTQICVFNTRLFSLHNTLNYVIHGACLRMVLLTDVYRNLTSLWIKPRERAFKQFKSPVLNVLSLVLLQAVDIIMIYSILLNMKLWLRYTKVKHPKQCWNRQWCETLSVAARLQFYSICGKWELSGMCKYRVNFSCTCHEGVCGCAGRAAFIINL